jgi:hypothetical protein
MRKFLILSLLAFAFFGVASAQRLFSEDFNYKAGQLTGLNHGENVSGGNWITTTGTSKPLQIVKGSLRFPGYTSSPSRPNGHLLLGNGKKAERAYISFSRVQNNTAYASFLLKVDSIGSLTPHYFTKSGFFAGFYGDAFWGKIQIRKGGAPNTYNLGIVAVQKPTIIRPISWISTDFAAGSTYLVTLSYEVTSYPRGYLVKLWVNPPNVPNEPSAQVSSFSPNSKAPIISRFAVNQGIYTPKCEIDAIKISTSWYDATWYDVTLPLRLISFSVVNDNGYAHLTWETANEVNVKNFEVEKSYDTRSFSAIGNISAKNASSATYSYNDIKLLTGTAYYRIKMVDNDGAAKYSGVVSVTGKLPAEISVFPNPVVNNLTLIHPQAANNAIMQLYALDGKLVLLRNVQIGAVQTSIDVSALSKGVYIVVFTNGNNKQSFKFEKQ